MVAKCDGSVLILHKKITNRHNSVSVLAPMLIYKYETYVRSIL